MLVELLLRGVPALDACIIETIPTEGPGLLPWIEHPRRQSQRLEPKMRTAPEAVAAGVTFER